MSAESATLAGRAAAELLMVDVCTITRATGATVTDPVTGVVVDAVAAIYSGRCRVQSRALTSQQAAAGEAVYEIVPYELHVPMAVVGVRSGDFALITASALDPDLVGRSFRVESNSHKTYATARRFRCTEGGPGE